MEKGVDYPGITTVFYCHDGEGNFVMNKRNGNCRDEKYRWDIGGGGLKKGKTLEENLRKEIKEEYTADCLKIEYLGFREMLRNENKKSTHWIGFDYKVLVDRDKVSNGEPHKFDAVEWFSLDNLPSPVHSQFPEFLRKYKHLLI
jgi:8-oxo-dGTP diphosphatase